MDKSPATSSSPPRTFEYMFTGCVAAAGESRRAQPWLRQLTEGKSAPCGKHVAADADFCDRATCGAYLGWSRTTAETPSPSASPIQTTARADLAPAFTARLAAERLNTEPGHAASVEIVVKNSSSIVEQYNFAITGPLTAFTRFEPSYLRLYPGEEASARLTFAPPAVPAHPPETHRSL